MDGFGSDDNIPLANLKAKKCRSPFQELLPTPLLIKKTNESPKNKKH